MIITYSFLFAAIIFGTISNLLAKDSQGFTKLIPSIGSVITIIICMYCLSQVMKYIYAGYTYAIFAGFCIIATTAMGIIRFNQWPNFFSFIGLILIIIGVLLVNIFANK